MIQNTPIKQFYFALMLMMCCRSACRAPSRVVVHVLTENTITTFKERSVYCTALGRLYSDSSLYEGYRFSANKLLHQKFSLSLEMKFCICFSLLCGPSPLYLFCISKISLDREWQAYIIFTELSPCVMLQRLFILVLWFCFTPSVHV